MSMSLLKRGEFFFIGGINVNVIVEDYYNHGRLLFPFIELFSLNVNIL